MLLSLAVHGQDVVCGTGEQRAVIEGIEVSADHTPTPLEAASIVVRFGRPIVTTLNDGRSTRAPRELLTAPIGREPAIGIIALTRETGSFAISDIDLLSPWLSAAGSAIERDRSHALEAHMSDEVGRLSSMLGTMLQRSDFTVIVTDAQGHVELMNDAAARTFGGRSAAEDHWSIDRLLAPGSAHGSLSAALAAYEADAGETEWSFGDRAGRSFVLAVTASPIFAADGTLRGWTLIGRAAEDRARAERDRVERVRLNAQVELLQRRERQLAALAEATQYVVASHTHREALDVIDHTLPSAFGAGAAELLRVVGDERRTVPRDPSLVRPADCWALRTGRAFRSELGAHVRCAHVEPGVRAVCAPVGDGLEWSGVIVLRFGADDDLAGIAATEALLGDVAGQLSNALANLRLRRALEDQATRDPLTGVGNRRAADDALATAIARNRSHGEPFGVVLVDLDYFKEVNDVHGHEVGDAALTAFADFLRRHTREDDRVTRIGGEEFLLVLRDIEREALDVAVEALRAGISRVEVRPGVTCTASFGAVHVTTPSYDADELVAAADRLMYESKHAGRDRVSVADIEELHERFGAPR